MRLPDWLARWRGQSCRPRLAATVLLACTLALGACAYHGSFDDPIQRRFQWFSYLDGGDIRQACSAGTIDRYRLVYNARYADQVRSYELVGDGAGGAYLVARARGPYANLTRISSDDPLAPWRWNKSQTRLSPAEFAIFKDALATDGFLQPPKTVGRRFSSDRFYWLASGCRDGVFHFGAWIYPSTDFARLGFVAFLFQHDGTGVPIDQPRSLAAGERSTPAGGQRSEADADTPFMITIRPDGIGAGSLF